MSTYLLAFCVSDFDYVEVCADGDVSELKGEGDGAKRVGWGGGGILLLWRLLRPVLDRTQTSKEEDAADKWFGSSCMRAETLF